MGYKTGVDKKQLSLLPTTPDDYIPEDHICRLISASTERRALVTNTLSRHYDPV